MIGYIEGTVVHGGEGYVTLLTVSGVGYQVYSHTVANSGDRASFFVSHILREDVSQLYGFSHFEDKHLFEKLLTVSGVGPKSAFALMSLGSQAVSDAIIFDNPKALQNAPGIGAKAAAKIILELKSKVSQGIVPNKKGDIAFGGGNMLLGEALQACEGLGFNAAMMIPIAKKMMQEREYQTSAELVQALLKNRGAAR